MEQHCQESLIILNRQEATVKNEQKDCTGCNLCIVYTVIPSMCLKQQTRFDAHILEVYQLRIW